MVSRLLRLVFVLPLWLALAAAAPTWAQDPPGRVARLSLVEGGVSLRPADSDDTVEATRNFPLTDGDVLATDGDGRAEVAVGSSVVRLDRASALTVRRIDDEHVRVRLEYGSVAVRVKSRDPADAVEVETREGSAVADVPGQYRIDAGEDRLALTAWHGRLHFRGPDGDATVSAGERTEVWAGERTEYRNTEPERDDFDAWSLARDRRDDAREPRYVSREMTGADDLDDYGDWHTDPTYGAAWYPRAVAADWAPYRYGRWVWVEPWGWTWVDDAPWGFAPFHYGRWVLIHGRWAWLPGRYVARPVYAPALVVWLGGPGWSVSFSSGAGPAVGWFPLGPRDVFVPTYRCSPTYIRHVNVTHVTSITRITEVVREPRRARYAFRDDPHAVTVVPADALRRGERVHRVAVRDPKPWIKDAPVARTAPVVAERRGVEPGRRGPAEVRRDERRAAPRAEDDRRPPGVERRDGDERGRPAVPRAEERGRPATPDADERGPRRLASPPARPAEDRAQDRRERVQPREAEEAPAGRARPEPPRGPRAIDAPDDDRRQGPTGEQRPRGRDLPASPLQQNEEERAQDAARARADDARRRADEARRAQDAAARRIEDDRQRAQAANAQRREAASERLRQERDARAQDAARTRAERERMDARRAADDARQRAQDAAAQRLQQQRQARDAAVRQQMERPREAAEDRRPAVAPAAPANRGGDARPERAPRHAPPPHRDQRPTDATPG